MINKILITGGAGFIGSNIAINLKKEFASVEMICFDNLTRRGSELNIERLKKEKIKFVHGDVRNKEDLESIGKFDILIDCAAEPSVLAELTESPEKIININLNGTLNCLEACRKVEAKMIFLSTSRIYPVNLLNKIKLMEKESRFEISEEQFIKGISSRGVSEDLEIGDYRTLYGATKLCSELIIKEYVMNYEFNVIINRCGVVAGPWQMGKVDQGVISLWTARHTFGGDLAYIGFGGEGKQVRDVLHIEDLCRLIKIQIDNFEKYNGGIFNVGGGREVSISLKELTNLCEEITGNKINIKKINENRWGDIPCYITDNTKITKISGWKPEKSVKDIVKDIYDWLISNKEDLKKIL